jgi:asparagine synthase (glutamine-hydrolysing)
MCGIAGVLAEEGRQAASAAPLIQQIAHRGPNGIRTEDGPGWSIGHARLSIIDLEGGWQPLHAAGSTIIGNGEIYNYLELAEAFQLKGRLATGSDFEPLLHIYAQEGEQAFDRLRGMYAFCLIGCDGRTWLVRDPFGIKPLSVTRDPDRLNFASEPRALFGPGHARQLQPEAAEDLLTLGYVTPGVIRPNTIFRGVESVLPGETDLVSGGEREEAMRQPLAVTAPLAGDEASLIRRLDAVLEDSVRVHQRSDVPYGLFLSGGIDSATVATLMSRLNERPVVGFTCGFDAPGARDERAQAEKVAKALNLDWRETTFTEADFWRIAPQVAWALDEPTTDYAALPTFKLAEAARGDLTVVLTGEGGDELFGGYGRYRRALRPAWLGGRAAEPQIDAPFLEGGGANALKRWRQAAAPPKGLTGLQRAQWGDIATWLPNDLLLKLDRCLMANGLEGRTPFLDREVAAFAFNLPDAMKVRGKYGKWLLRKWLEGACPAADPWGRKKGFTVPVAAWIAPRAADLGPRIAGVRAVAETCDAAAVRAVFSDEGQSHNRWPLLFFALWSQIHLEQAEPTAALKALLGEA